MKRIFIENQHLAKKNELNSEKGITVIALIITVIVLLILTTIITNGMNGNDEIIEQAQNSVQTFAIQNYQEQLSKILVNVIKEQEILGGDVTLSGIATRLNTEDWVESATASNDILIKTVDGYIFQVYYNNQYGQKYLEFLGKDDGDTLPSITMQYNDQTKVITVTSAEVQKIELIYNGQVVRTQNGTSLTYTAEKTGWYKAKVTTSSGKEKYAWIRASIDNLNVTFQVTSQGETENGWYGKDNEPVEVTITGNGSKIYYKLGTAVNYTEVAGTTTTVTINTVGKTTIYAYTEDANSNESEIYRMQIKFDNIKPSLGEVTVTGEATENGTFYSDVIVSLDNATDANSGIAGYYWWLDSGNDNTPTYVKGTTKTITIRSIGQKRIGLRAKDRAGNLSEISIEEITKVLLVEGITLNKLTSTINVGATDTLTATISPNDATDKTVTWSSSNTSVATVSSEGVVTGVAAGTATITAAANDGSGITASCTVTVTPALISFTIDGTLYEAEKGITWRNWCITTNRGNEGFSWNMNAHSIRYNGLYVCDQNWGIVGGNKIVEGKAYTLSEAKPPNISS